MPRTDRTFESRGTTQYDRAIEAIKPEFVRIDDRTLPDLLAFAAGYSKLIRFYNEKNQVDDTWEEFYTTDISVLLAVILSTDVEAIHDQWQEALHKIRISPTIENKVEGLQAMFAGIYHIFGLFDKWYRQLARISLNSDGLEHQVHTDLYNAITLRLIPEYRRFRDYTGSFEKVFKTKLQLDFDGHHPVWQGQTPETDPLFEKGTEIAAKELLAQKALIKLQLVYESCIRALLYIVQHFERHFQVSVHDKQDHKPDIGLFIAFLKTFGYLQDATNGLSSKVLDLYYHTVLQQQRAPDIPDRVFVCLGLASHLQKFTLPAGTKLQAGRDATGVPILYETLQDITVNHAQVVQLKTLYFHKDPRETISNYEIVTHLNAAAQANSRDGHGTPFNTDNASWPTFGESQLDKLDDRINMRFGFLGFAISSPMFFLREGRRAVELTFHFNPDSVSIFDKLIRDVRRKFELKTTAEAFYKVFNPAGKLRNISIFASGVSGWIPVDPQLIKVYFDESEGWRPDSFTISFVLDVSDPPVVAFNPDVYPHEHYDDSLPAIKVVLNGDREPYAYSFLKHLKVARVDMRVEVDRIKRFQLYNDIGQVDATQPFQPFGSLPATGSYLLIGNNEIFQKPLETLDIDIRWQNLPQTFGAFREFYRDYGLDARDYMVSLAALSKNEFLPGEDLEQLEYPLFMKTTVPRKEDHDVKIETKFHLDAGQLEHLDITPEPILPEENAFDNNTQSGYLKIELTAPEDGFGHAAYQEIITKTMSKNSKIISDAVRKDEEIDTDSLNIPNAPLIPLVKSLAISYSASETLDINDDRPEYPQTLSHVHPFGTELIYPNKGRQSQNEAFLLPQFEADGHLYIGLADARPLQTIRLYFQLIAVHIRDHSRLELPDVRWEYLSYDNQWQSLDKGDFQSDATDRFTKSGIISFRLPGDASMQTTVVPAGLYWMRIAVAGEVELLCHTIDVRTQGVEAQWFDNGAARNLREVLPPGAVQKMAEALPAIRQVVQPFESFGGRAEENDEEFYTRVSERIRHKHRAITFWDYERLVLKEFPDVFQVKCLSSFRTAEVVELSRGELVGTSKFGEGQQLMSHSKGRFSDAITLVVVPRKPVYLNNPTPVFNYRSLERIRDYVQQFSTPFVRVYVRNPSYEYFRVYCKVKFVDEGESGTYQEMLADEVRKFTCPWLDDHKSTMQIGGKIAVELLKQHLSSLPYVRFITRFSLLHIIEAGDEYRLEDTADSKNAEQAIYASMPWSVLIPDPDHQFELMDPLEDEIEELPSRVTAPVRFKTRHNILKRTTFIRIIRSTEAGEGEPEDDKGKDTYSLNIKI